MTIPINFQEMTKKLLFILSKKDGSPEFEKVWLLGVMNYKITFLKAKVHWLKQKLSESML